ncbi:amino acid adenylation domain-containing protein, partial [Acidobacteriota bacterium]
MQRKKRKSQIPPPVIPTDSPRSGIQGDRGGKEIFELQDSNREDNTTLLSDSEKQKLLLEWNDRAREYPRDRCIHEWFEEQANRSPDKIAILSRDMHVTYLELNCRANRLAHHLRLAGVDPETPIGIFMDRSPGLPTALLAVLKAGGAYVPLDPEYPRERVTYILEQSGVRAVLTENHLIKRLSFYRGKRVLIDSDWHEITQRSKNNPISGVRAANLAYIIYTSGSTGVPKGVAIQHSSTGALIAWALNRFDKKDFSGVLASTSVCFDLSVFEIFVTLSSGGTIILVDSVLDLPSIKASDRVSLINTVPSAMRELLVIGAFPSCCRIVNLAGEPLKKELVNKIYDTGLVSKVFDLYGPSEDTTYSTVSLRKQGGIETIGVPIDNTKAYILDENLNPAPISVPGELYLSGSGLARGYYNRPDLTAERFIPNPFDSTGGRLYRTGDLARYQDNGNIIFLGRIDHQVKIRGFRIECGEIESVVAQYAGVSEVVVLAREDMPGDKQLVAYVVPVNSEGISTGGLREFLLQRLPTYMVPSAFVQLEVLPLTPNGKIDHRALPAPDWDRSSARAEYVAPRNTVEELMAAIWRDVLGLGKVGIDDNFLELGGHSLKATQLVSKLHKTFNVKLSLDDIFQAATVRALADLLKDVAPDSHIPVAAVEKKEHYPISSAQKRIYVSQQLDPGSTTYNIVAAYFITGSVDREKLENTFKGLIERHESFRTAFDVADNKTVQKIADSLPFEIEIHRAKNSFESGSHHKQFLTNTIKNFTRPFDLSNAPLLRAGLFEPDQGHPLLVVDMHHIISDGISLDIFQEELCALYDGIALPRMRVQYKDYSEWLRHIKFQEQLRKQEAYWLNEFSGERPLLDLPADYKRPPIRSYEGATYFFDLPGETFSRLEQMARDHKTTLYILLLSMYTVLLGKLSTLEDILIGTPASGRRHDDVEQLVGMFVNTLILRNFPSAEKSFAHYLKEVKNRTLAAFENQEYQFDDLVEKVVKVRESNRNPLFDVVFALENFVSLYSGTGEEDLGIRSYPYKEDSAKFDLNLTAYEGEDSLRFGLEYSSKLFKKETAKRFADYFLRIMAAVIENPVQKLSHIDILSPEEKSRVLFEFNDLGIEYTSDKTIHGLFVDQVSKTPGNIALVETGIPPVTYEVLNGEIDALAYSLIKKGAGPGMIVGLLTDRSIDMITGILGILKSGAAYLPLNPKNPAERNRFMLADCNVSILLAREQFIKGMKEVWHGDILNISDRQLYKKNGGLSAVSAADPAYVIYTSGSTGTPKGVIITHNNFSPLVHWGFEHLRINEDDRALQNLSYYFDWSVWEIFLVLGSGASLYLADEEILLNGKACIDFIRENNITVLHITPTQYSFLLNEGEKLDTLKQLCVGAEKMSVEMARRCVESVNPGCRVYNMYGPTEATIIAAVLDVDTYDIA